MKKVAILYICTGNYTVFWKDFYTSSEKYLFSDENIEKHYIVFTDKKEEIKYSLDSKVTVIHQDIMPWPQTTLFRFKIFNKARKYLKKMDYIFFFNANMLFKQHVGSELLPDKCQPLVMVKHPGFFDKSMHDFTYDKNKKSRAYVPDGKGDFYFMGGLNGGYAPEYLALIDELESRIDQDFQEGIVALWHDESHLNRYAIDHAELVKVLDPEFGYPEGLDLPFPAKILIRDKNNFGGHGQLRGEKRRLIDKFKRFFRA